MQKLIGTLSALVMLSGGVAATVVDTAAPATSAVVCASRINPTINYIVTTVCSRFGP